MRTIVLILVASACGNVKTPKSEPDAGSDSMISPDAGSAACTTLSMMQFSPPWLTQGMFQRSPDPAGGTAMAWRATQVPFSASFNVPYQAGDRILGLVFDAYGDNNDYSAGLMRINVYYQPDGSDPMRLIAAQAVGLEAKWKHIPLGGIDGFSPFDLAAGKLWVEFDVTEMGYYVGDVMTLFGRSCP